MLFSCDCSPISFDNKTNELFDTLWSIWETFDRISHKQQVFKINGFIFHFHVFDKLLGEMYLELCYVYVQSKKRVYSLNYSFVYSFIHWGKHLLGIYHAFLSPLYILNFPCVLDTAYVIKCMCVARHHFMTQKTRVRAHTPMSLTIVEFSHLSNSKEKNRQKSHTCKSTLKSRIHFST